MASIALLTAAYEAARPYLTDWIEGALEAACGRDVRVVIAIDGLVDPESAFAPLLRELPVTLVPAGGTPAAVRGAMLRAGRESDAEVLVFVDMDDVPLADAFHSHLAALSEADFSYGDMGLIDDDGTPLGPTFFRDCAIPERLAGKSGRRALIARNFLGFTNTALRRASLDRSACAIPDGLVAADWWLFTALLRTGRRGAKTAAPVVRYRMHPGNMFGGRPDPNPAAVARRIEIARRHYAALADDPDAAEWEQAYAQLALKIQETGNPMARKIENACAAPGVWFEDVAQLARGYLRATTPAQDKGREAER